jgi:hypothetical protein
MTARSSGLRLALAALLGAVTAIGIAWFAATPEGWLPFVAFSDNCMERMRGSASADILGMTISQPILPAPNAVRLVDTLKYEPWRRMVLPSLADGRGYDRWVLHTRGFPFRCFAAGDYYPRNGAHQPIGWLNPGGRFQIATIPMWRGLFASSAVWMLPWLYLFFAHGAVRRYLWERRRPGLCPHCRYDLLHDYAGGCPECGWNR